MTTGRAVALEWGLRRTFLAYVSALPDGSIAVDAPAEFDGEVFRLPGSWTGRGECRFDGVLRFFGHAGVLNVELEDLRAEWIGASKAEGRITASVGGVRIPLADFSEPAHGVEGATTYRTVTLTDDGAAVLGGVYPPGAVADPVTIRPAS